MCEHTKSAADVQIVAAWKAELARERQLQPAISRERQEAARLAFRRLRELYRVANSQPAA
jgi:hypothetical protein